MSDPFFALRARFLQGPFFAPFSTYLGAKKGPPLYCNKPGQPIAYFRFKPEVDHLGQKTSLFRFELIKAVQLRVQPSFSDSLPVLTGNDSSDQRSDTIPEFVSPKTYFLNFSSVKLNLKKNDKKCQKKPDGVYLSTKPCQ